MSSWVFLYVAVLLEVVGTVSLKLSRGFTVLLPSLVAMAFYGLSLGSLNLALKHLPVSIAYAIWSGLGTTLVAVIGVVHFREPITAVRLVSLLLVGIGVVGLNLSGARH